MTRIFKKITALAVAAAVISANTVLPASAATAAPMAIGDSDIDSWGLHANPQYSHTTDEVGVIRYMNGYKGCMTYSSGTAKINYVTVSADYMNDVEIYEIGKNNARDLKPSQIEGEYAYFTVKMTYKNGNVASNNGKIMISAVWDQFEL